jgi:hypothetical protein
MQYVQRTLEKSKEPNTYNPKNELINVEAKIARNLAAKNRLVH